MPSGLPTAKLGITDLEVTKLGFGAMEIRGVPRGRDVTAAQADTTLNAVLDSGINYIDTSIDYGLSEGFIGNYISNRRDEYFLASKCGCMVSGATVPSGPQPHVYTTENITVGIEQSLRRMKTDYLDVVQFHGSPTQETLEENGSIDTLLELKQQGKIRHIGMSGTLPNLPKQIDMAVFDVLQIPYSALERQHEDLISKAADADIGNVIRGGVAKGEPDESGVSKPDLWKIFEKAGLDELVDEGESRTDFLLRFTLSHPSMHTTIIGTLNPDHVKQNVATANKGALASDVYEKAKSLLAAAGETSA
ncbi:MAG: aldo/keto reductase [Dehalococcoidia bacterium]|nr:aldo/keto reductase [Dehalococcoidia bacterium]